MIPQSHNAVMKTSVRAFLPPFQGSHAWGKATQGSAFGFTLGYIPAAASRLKIFVIAPVLNGMHARFSPQQTLPCAAGR